MNIDSKSLDHRLLALRSKKQQIRNLDQPLVVIGLFDRVIFRCVIGSRAYGLQDAESDTDRDAPDSIADFGNTCAQRKHGLRRCW